MTVYHTYPHEDLSDTGARAARLLLRLLDEGLRPATARVPIPALVRGDEADHRDGHLRPPHRQCGRSRRAPAASPPACSSATRSPTCPSCAPTASSSRRDPERSAREARRLAAGFLGVRERCKKTDPVGGGGAHRRARREGTVVMMDAADATAPALPATATPSCAPVWRAGYQGSALLPIIDPPAAAACLPPVSARRCARRRRRLRPGALPAAGVEGRVHLLAEGRFIARVQRGATVSGPTAVLEGAELHAGPGAAGRWICTTAPSFLAHGQDPRQFDLVVVKSPHCKPHMYADWCARLINVDAPGATSANLRSLGHRACPRPIFPLDAAVTFRPHVGFFSAQPRHGRWRRA